MEMAYISSLGLLRTSRAVDGGLFFGVSRSLHDARCFIWFFVHKIHFIEVNNSPHVDDH